MGEILMKSGTYPNVAIPAGSDPIEVMERYGVRQAASAMYEGETCHIVMISPGWWECDECGSSIYWDSYDENDPPACSYCPNCGMKVRSNDERDR